MNPTEVISSLNDNKSRIATEIMLRAMRLSEKYVYEAIEVSAHRDAPVVDTNGTSLPITVDDIIAYAATQAGDVFKEVIIEHLSGVKQ